MGKELHASRLLTLISLPVSDLLKPAYNFGGISMIQMGKPYVENWLNTRQSVADLIKSFTIPVLAMNMSAILNGVMDEQVYARIDLFNKQRSNRGAFLIDKEAEEFEFKSAPLGGLDALQQQSLEHLASVWRIPLVKLTGIQPERLEC